MEALLIGEARIRTVQLLSDIEQEYEIQASKVHGQNLNLSNQEDIDLDQYNESVTDKENAVENENKEGIQEISQELHVPESYQAPETIHENEIIEESVRKKKIKNKKANKSRKAHSKPFKYTFDNSVNRPLKKVKWAIIFILIIGIGFTGYHFVNNDFSIFSKNMSSKNSEEVYQNLIEKKSFAKASKEFPERYPDIENKIFALGEEGIPYLEEYIKTFPDYKQAQFDLAFLKKDYDRVTQLNNLADTDARKTELAIAYINTDQLTEGKKINKLIKNDEIAKLIDNHYYTLAQKALLNNDVDQAKKLSKESEQADINTLIDTYQSIEEQINKIEKLPDKDKTDDSQKALSSLRSKKEELLKN